MDIFSEEDPQLLLDEAVLETSSAPETPITHRHILSTIILGVGLMLGVAGNALFYGRGIGINITLFVGLLILTALGMTLYFDKPRSQHLIFYIPTLIFAIAMTVITSYTLNTLNLLAALFALMIATRFTATQTFLGGSWQVVVSETFQAIFASWFQAPLVTLADSIPVLRRIKLDGDQARQISAVIRGVIFTVPVLVVFGILLGSADVAFGDALDTLIAWIRPDSLDSTLTQLGIIACFAVLAITGLRTALFACDLTLVREEKRKPGLRLSMIETGMILTSVNALFFVFILFQWRYLFGGEANITAQGYTYAEYARRGFEELLMVSGLTIALILTLEHVTIRDRQRLFRGLATLMIGLTTLLLVAALYRLYLYENAYGYTRIRVSSGVFMLWLAVLLGFLVHDILRDGTRCFWMGCVVVGFGFVLTLNLINMDAFIAQQNIDRWERGEELDVYYLTTLSNDAVPLLVELFDDPDLTESQRYTLGSNLNYRLHRLHRTDDLLAYHFGRERAWSALNAHREQLAEYDWGSRSGW